MAKKVNDLAHTKWLCKYHIVFRPEYRRTLFSINIDVIWERYSGNGVTMGGDIGRASQGRPCAYVGKYSSEIERFYVHGILKKGKSALMMFDRHADLKYKLGNRYFGSEGYYVTAVGMNEKTIRKYIRDPEKADVMKDKLGVKEYEDPFKSTEK